MYSKIMVPVDLGHVDAMSRAVDVATDLAGHWNAELVFVGVTAALPGKVAHNPEEYARKLKQYADEHSDGHNVRASAHPVVSHDPAADMDDHLLKSVDDTGADLVVMATHSPGVAEGLWPSHGGSLARHSKTSVMLVRAG